MTKAIDKAWMVFSIHTPLPHSVLTLKRHYICKGVREKCWKQDMSHRGTISWTALSSQDGWLLYLATEPFLWAGFCITGSLMMVELTGMQWMDGKKSLLPPNQWLPPSCFCACFCDFWEVKFGDKKIEGRKALRAELVQPVASTRQRNDSTSQPTITSSLQ